MKYRCSLRSNSLKIAAAIPTAALLASLPVLADDAPKPVLPSAPVTQTAPMPTASSDKDWYANISGDYYNFRSTFQSSGSVTINSGPPAIGNGSKQGSLYGGTLDIAPPCWYKGGELNYLAEFSFHVGRLGGGVVYTAGPDTLNTFVNTDWEQYSLYFKMYPKWMPFYYEHRTFWVLSVGAEYDDWSSSETITTPDFIWTATGTPTQNYDLKAGLGDAAIEYGVYFLNQSYNNGSALRLGARGQGFGGIGYGSQTGDAGKNDSVVYNLGGKATVFVDYKIPLSPNHLFTVFAEGGWLYTYWGSANNSVQQSSTDSIKGPYARAGVKFSF